ncbi:MAG: hypothetical protein KKH08_00170 [Candidatus Omnitrophica bacterium]|nr:hypothetical protein [Candidatus Omnitrophota bacterium]
MIKFKKVYNLKTIVVAISLVFFLCATTYALNLPGKLHLRVPAASRDRIQEAELHLLLANLKKNFEIGDDWDEKLFKFAKTIGKDRLMDIANQTLDPSNLKKYIEDFLIYGDLVSEIEDMVEAKNKDVLKLARSFIVKVSYRAYLNNIISIKSCPVSEMILLRSLLTKLVNKLEFYEDFNALKRIVNIFGFMYDYNNLKTLEYIDSSHGENALMHYAWSASEYLHDVLMPSSNIVGTIRDSIHKRCNAKETLKLVKKYIDFIETGEIGELHQGVDRLNPADYNLRSRYKEENTKAKEAYDLLVEIRGELLLLFEITSQKKLELLSIWLANTEIKDDDFVRDVAIFAKKTTEGNESNILRLISDFRINLIEKIDSAEGVNRFELLELDYAIEKILLYSLGDFYDSLEKKDAEGKLTASDLFRAVYDLGILLDCDYISPKSMTEFSATFSDPYYNTILELHDICKLIRERYQLTIETIANNYKPFIAELSFKKGDIKESLEDKLFRQIVRQEFKLNIFINVVSLLEKELFLMPNYVSDDMPLLSLMHLKEALDLPYKERLYLRRLYGGKASSLVTMAKLGFSVPQAFFMTPIKKFNGQQLSEKLKNNIRILEEVIHIEDGMSLKFGNIKNPLLVSVRSGSFVSFPGAMKTIPFVGINDEIAKSIAKETGNIWFAYDSYRRFLEAYGMYILGMDFKIFDEIIDAKKLKYKVHHKDDLSDYAMKNLAFKYKKAIEDAGYGDELEQVLRDHYHALSVAIKSVSESWDSREAIAHRKLTDISDDWGTSVVVQRMVYGNFKSKKSISGTAVVFSHDRLDKTQKLTGEFYPNAYGGDVVGGLVKPYKIEYLQDFIREDVYRQLERDTKILSNKRRYPQEMEITIENGRIWWLQCRDNYIFRNYEYIPFNGRKSPILTGNGVSGGTFIGKVIFDPRKAVSMYKKAKTEGLDGVILLLHEAKLPSDITSEELKAIGGFISVLGGPSSHIAQFATLNNRTAIIGLFQDLVIFEDKKHAKTADSAILIKEEDVLSIDGNPSGGKIYEGRIERMAIKDTINKSVTKVDTYI